ncbi:hypothetical protein CcCBS67573_g08931 [Chytriomyces confervae]|uniref:FAD-binding domain-containing protein n=1 Tax=Chytriomyces confervae TaxID=246404 RepID=A0A507EC27_9FUNG|nr:hypothetical protein CcCBS67573_g08931 [Chytriomyces confervae]
MNVVVIGTGLVGAATAFALHKAGIACTLYDQVDLVAAALNSNGTPLDVDFGDTGGSVLLAPSATRVLKSLGLFDEVVAQSSTSPHINWYKMDGSAAVQLDVVPLNARMEPDPELQAPLQILRSKLHSILLKACQQAGIRMFMGKKLVRVEEQAYSVTAHFADGTTAKGDLLVGADGIHSATRRTIFGESSKSQFTGVLGYIGVVDLVANNIKMNETCGFYIDRVKKELVCTFRVSEQIGAINIMTFHEPDPEETEGWRPYSDLPKHSARLAELVRGWGVPDHVEQMIRKAYRISPASIYDLPDLDAYHKGRTVLVGDAAHGMVPNAGLGLGTGMEDVGALFELFKRLPDQKDLHSVLSIYSKLRVPQATANANRSREMAKQYYSSSVLGPSFSHFLLRAGIFAFNHNLMKFYSIFDCPKEVEKAIASMPKA